MAKSFEEWWTSIDGFCLYGTPTAAKAAWNAGRASVLDSGGELPEFDAEYHRRQAIADDFYHGARHTPLDVRIGNELDCRERQLRSANSEIACLRALLAAPPTPPEET